MNLADAGHQVRDQILAAAALGDDRTREIAAALSQAADSAVRLAVLQALTRASTELADALSDAAAIRGLTWIPEISVQLDGDRLGFTVAAEPADTRADTAAGTDGTAGPDRAEATARISLRLTEALKAGIEQAADRADISVNSWLVRVATAALHEDPSRTGADGWASRQGGRGGKRISGWVTG
ncbi:MAG TPA: hypothetical protein VJ851_07935 [Jatrophihabitans sp.]|nr:hypothetical protein [Jatrophihabitans sp.]